MNYGRLIHRMQLETPESTTALGKVTTSWYPDGIVSAEISTLAGRELEQARQVVADATHQIRTRYSDRFRTKQRLFWENRYFYVEHVNNKDERRRETLLICTERVENG